MTPKFANILNYTINLTDLVLDFGAFFPTAPPSMPITPESVGDKVFHTRIVMSADMIEPLVTILEQLKKNRDEARKQQQRLEPAAQKADTIREGRTK